MSISGNNDIGAEIQDGLQVLEVGLVPEATGDSGRVEEEIVADETRHVHAFSATDPRSVANGDDREVELWITRESILAGETEVSVDVADGGTGFSYNHKVWEYGKAMNLHDTSGNEDVVLDWTDFHVLPAAIVWQEDESWHFGAFEAGGASGTFETHEIRVYFTQPAEAEIPRQRQTTS